MLNVNGGIVLSDTQKQTVKTGDANERLGAIMEALDQNVGNFNNSLLKTPLGKYAKEVNKLKAQQAELGETALEIKTQFLKLKNAMYPVIKGFIVGFGILFGTITKGFSMIGDAFNSISPIIGNLTGAIGGLSLVWAAFTLFFRASLIPFAPFIAIGTALYLLIEDIWTVIDRKSVV